MSVSHENNCPDPKKNNHRLWIAKMESGTVVGPFKEIHLEETITSSNISEYDHANFFFPAPGSTEPK